MPALPSDGGSSFHRDAPASSKVLGASRPLRWGAILILILGVFLRIASLGADPDWRLDWNPGLLTDEAFYAHNARNLALFGQTRLDEFNNMILSPIVHGLQVLVVKAFGVGYIPIRAISVAMSLMGIALFGRLLFLMFRNSAIAWLGAAWLAIDHAALLFSRTALLETPVAFFCVASAWALAEAAHRSNRPLAVLSAVLAVCAIATKSTAVAFLIGLLVAAWPMREIRRPFAVGMLSALAVWVGLWVLPNWDEWAHMQRYYLAVQGRPKDLWGQWLAIQRGVFGERYGLSYFMMLHAPIVWGLAVLLAAALASGGLWNRLSGLERLAVVWFWLTWAQMALIRVSPTRYMAAAWPALVICAIVLVARWPEVRAALSQRTKRAILARSLGFAWLIYLLSLAFMPTYQWRALRYPALEPDFQIRLLAFAVLLGWLIALAVPRLRLTWRWTTPALLAIAIFLNARWLTTYFSDLRYEIAEKDATISSRLPTGSVLQGVAFESPFRYFFTFKGLCNWRQPPEALGATHLLLLGTDETVTQKQFDALERWEELADISGVEQRLFSGDVGPYQYVVYDAP